MDDVRISYGDLLARVSDLSRALLANGVAHGDRVAMLTAPHPEFLVSMLATTDIGAIWLGLHPRYRLPELHHVIGEAEPKVVLAFDEIDGRGYSRELEALSNAHACVEEIVVLGETIPGTRGFDDFVSSGSGVSDSSLQRARSAAGASGRSWPTCRATSPSARSERSADG